MVIRPLVLALALAAAGPQATVTPGVDLVRFDVRVVDDAGRPVTDLRLDEIVVEEGGKALPVMELQRIADAAESYAEAAVRALSAEVSSNEASPRGHLYILVFDQQHMSPGNELRARGAAEQFVRRRVRPSDRVAVLGVPGPAPQVGFTADRMRAIQALDSVRGMYEGSASTKSSRQFLQRLADLVAQFRDIEGRKTVVLFSEGFFQDDLARDLEAVAASAAQSHCVFFTFDLNPRSGAPKEGTSPGASSRREIESRIAPLATLALETDGLMVPDAGARVEQALDRITEQPLDYYLVGFAPSPIAKTSRGTYQRVTVKVKRAGARVTARTGYTVAPEPTAEDKRHAVNVILGAPFIQQAVRIAYTTYVMKAPEPGQHRIVLSLNAELPVRSAPSDVADVVFVARDVRDGRVVASGTDTIALPATPLPGTTLGTGIWSTQFDLPAGAYVMRAVVREPGGLAGSADRRVDVRSFHGPEVTASDLVIGSTPDAMPVRPRVLPETGLTGAIETYGRTAAQLEGLAVNVELRGVDNATVKTIAATLGPAEAEGGTLSRRASFQLPLAGVPTGDYIARAIISTRGGVVAERSRQVEVVGAPAPVAAAETSAVSPLDVTRGDLGQKYIALIQERARATPFAEAAAQAAAGRWEEVELALAKTGNGDKMPGHALKGLALFVREDYKGAAGALDRALALEQQPLTAFFLGWAQQGAGDSRAALSAWRSAARLDPSMVSAHLALADGYLRLAQPALAIQALRAGLAAIPGSVELRTRLQQVERIPQAPK